MNSIHRNIAIALLVAAAAARADIGQTTLQRVEVIAPSAALSAARLITASPFFDATYMMSSGRQMSVAAAGDAVELRYGRKPTRLLRHDGQGRFVSADGTLVLQFGLDDRGELAQVSLSLPKSWA
jgi:hypothetical protein